MHGIVVTDTLGCAVQQPTTRTFFTIVCSTFGASKRWLGTNADGSARQLTALDYYKVSQSARGATWLRGNQHAGCGRLCCHPGCMASVCSRQHKARGQARPHSPHGWRARVLQAGAITGFTASFFEAPIDFYKSQIQVQIIRAKTDPAYKRECGWALARGSAQHAVLAAAGLPAPLLGVSHVLGQKVKVASHGRLCAAMLPVLSLLLCPPAASLQRPTPL